MPTVVIAGYEFPDRNTETTAFEDAGIRVVNTQADSPRDVVEVASELNADALLVQSARIKPAMFNVLEGTDVVGTSGIGTDKRSATGHEVRVLNVPDYCQDDVAEHTLSLVLCCERTFPRFDAAAFERTRSNADLISTSRGPVTDTDALTDAVRKGELWGAGLNVPPGEPPGDSSLFDREDVILTTYVARCSEDSLVDLRETIASDIARALTSWGRKNVVNTVTRSHETAAADRHRRTNA
jgi:phosphoglycerate dehydrogenase-like enzyme